MSLLVFPSQNKPQFYLSNNKYVIDYFINNFLFSGKLKIQLLLNIIKVALPNTLQHLLINVLLKKENTLPAVLSETFNNIKEFIANNKKVFLSGNNSYADIHFIMRISTWQRANDKFVIIFFINGNKDPFVVAKVGSFQYKDSIELEHNNTKAVYNKFNNNNSISIPEPLAFYKSDKMVAYFERSIEGTPINNFLKLIFNTSSKQYHYIDILNQCKDFIVQLSSEKQALTSIEFLNYILTPIENFKKTDCGKKYSLKLNRLISEAERLQKKQLHSVWMHGDLWGGSVLYSDGKIGIIDWEFLTFNGIPVWDFYSIAFHAGEGINTSKFNKLADFMIYFNNIEISQEVDRCLLEIANSCQIHIRYLPLLFQCYLLFNIQNRDTSGESYWQDCLEYYWSTSDTKTDSVKRLL